MLGFFGTFGDVESGRATSEARVSELLVFFIFVLGRVRWTSVFTRVCCLSGTGQSFFFFIRTRARWVLGVEMLGGKLIKDFF